MVTDGARFHRRIGRFLTAPARPVWLCHDADDLMWSGGDQRVERRHGEGRRAEKHDPQPFYHFPARVSF